MASPVLRIIFGDVSDSRKMHLDSGITATLSELHMLVKTFFDLKEHFRLQYVDEDFNVYMNLTSRRQTAVFTLAKELPALGLL